MASFQMVVLLMSLTFPLLVVPTQALKRPSPSSSRIKAAAVGDLVVKGQHNDSPFETIVLESLANLRVDLNKVRGDLANMRNDLTDLRINQAKQYAAMVGNFTTLDMWSFTMGGFVALALFAFFGLLARVLYRDFMVVPRQRN